MAKSKELIDSIYNEDAVRVGDLMTQGCNPMTEYRGLLPLVEAARVGSVAILEVLIQAGARVDDPQSNGGPTALMAAAGEGHHRAVQYLVEQGADPNIVVDGVSNALSEATIDKSAKRTKVVEILLAAGANARQVFHSRDGVAVSNVLMAACRAASVDAVKLLINAGALVNEQLFFGTALTSACDAGRDDIAELLLSSGADPLLRVTNAPDKLKMAGLAPLEIAVAKRHKKVIAVLANHAGRDG